MDLNTLKSAIADTSSFGGSARPRESQMFHVKHGDVPRRSVEHSQNISGPAAAGANRKTKRAPLSFEEVASAADAIFLAGEKVTIERVRQAVGGGGNQAVMGHLSRWRELRRKGAQFGMSGTGGGASTLMSETLKAALAQAIDDEIQRQRESAQDAVHERLDELQEARGALEADLKIATDAAFEQEADLEQMSAALALAHKEIAAEQHQSALAREKLLGQVETLSAQAQTLQAALDGAKEAAVEARVKDAGQVSQIAALLTEVKRLREASDGAKSRISEAEQEAAVAQMQATGKDELLRILQGQLVESQARARELAEEARRSHERARAAEETQDKLRHKLDAAHAERQSGQQNMNPTTGPQNPKSHAAMGFGQSPKKQTREHDPSRPMAPSPARSAGADGSCATSAGAPQGSSFELQTRRKMPTPQERERVIDGLTPASMMQSAGKPATHAERERQKSLLIKAAELRGMHLQRGTDMVASDQSSRMLDRDQGLDGENLDV
jgi:hypothetical protein